MVSAIILNKIMYIEMPSHTVAVTLSFLRQTMNL